MQGAFGGSPLGYADMQICRQFFQKYFEKGTSKMKK
jgi:hypothetical protein